jgi:hypothetical protein
MHWSLPSEKNNELCKTNIFTFWQFLLVFYGLWLVVIDDYSWPVVVVLVVVVVVVVPSEDVELAMSEAMRALAPRPGNWCMLTLEVLDHRNIRP